RRPGAIRPGGWARPRHRGWCPLARGPVAKFQAAGTWPILVTRMAAARVATSVPGAIANRLTRVSAVTLGGSQAPGGTHEATDPIVSAIRAIPATLATPVRAAITATTTARARGAPRATSGNACP